MDSGDKNLDIGGGKYDDNTEWLSKFGIKNYVIDPFQRTLDHNVSILRLGRLLGGFDSVSLMSVLNVIPDSKDRIKVLQLAHRNLKERGRLFIKIWKGPGTEGKFQMNKDTTFYLDQVREIFPSAFIYAESFIFARK
jgi:SAM-dependent methyltransferase